MADVKSLVEKLKDNTAIKVVVAERGVIGFSPGIQVTFTTCFKDPLIAIAYNQKSTICSDDCVFQYGDDVTDNSDEQPFLIKLSYSWG